MRGCLPMATGEQRDERELGRWEDTRVLALPHQSPRPLDAERPFPVRAPSPAAPRVPCVFVHHALAVFPCPPSRWSQARGRGFENGRGGGGPACPRPARPVPLRQQLQRPRGLPDGSTHHVFLLSGLGRRRLLHAYAPPPPLMRFRSSPARVRRPPLPCGRLRVCRSTDLCPNGTAWTDYAVGVDNAHNPAVCSNRGVCDYSSGKCMCEEGFEGLACQRSTCPTSARACVCVCVCFCVCVRFVCVCVCVCVCV